MEVIGTDLEVKKGEKGLSEYYCEVCDFGNFSKGLFKLHMETKHPF